MMMSLAWSICMISSNTCGLWQASICLASLGSEKVGEPISSERLFDCVNVILSYQNQTGGWATYENTRTFAWVEVRCSAFPHFLRLTQLSPLYNIPRKITVDILKITLDFWFASQGICIGVGRASINPLRMTVLWGRRGPSVDSWYYVCWSCEQKQPFWGHHLDITYVFVLPAILECITHPRPTHTSKASRSFFWLFFTGQCCRAE